MTSEGKENVQDNHWKRRQRLSPRQRRRSEKQDSDGEEYCSDASDGRSSPKRRRRRKYSDIVRVERIFIEKNTHTKEEVLLDKLRRKKIKARTASSGDESDTMQISNYDSEGEIPINRSHRLGSMRSLNSYNDNPAENKTTTRRTKKRNKSKDPTSRLILQHVHFNQYVTKETEVVKYLPATDGINVNGEATAPVASSDDVFEAPVAEMAGPSVTSTKPTSTDQNGLNGAEAKLTQFGEQAVAPSVDGEDVQDGEIKTDNITANDNTDPVLIPGEIPTDTFPEENEFAKVERSPTLTKKAIIKTASPMDMSDEEILDSEDKNEQGNLVDVVDNGILVKDDVTSDASEQYMKSNEIEQIKRDTIDHLCDLSQMDVISDKTEHSAQTQDLQDFSPAVVNHIVNSESGEHLGQYRNDLPDMLQIVPGGIVKPTELLSGMTSHTTSVLKAGNVDVRNNINLVDQTSVGLECDIIGYDSFKAGLESEHGIPDCSSPEHLKENGIEKVYFVTQDVFSEGQESLRYLSKVLVNSETQTDDGYYSDKQNGHSSDSTELGMITGEFSSNNGLVGTKNIIEMEGKQQLNYGLPLCDQRADVYYTMRDSTETFTDNKSDVMGIERETGPLVGKQVTANTVETQTKLYSLESNETQTDSLEMKVESIPNRDYDQSTAETQTRLSQHTSDTQTVPVAVCDASSGSDDEMKDVIAIAVDKQTHEVPQKTNETQTVQATVADTSSGSDEEMKKLGGSIADTQTSETQTSYNNITASCGLAEEMKEDPESVSQIINTCDASTGSSNVLVATVDTQTRGISFESSGTQTLQAKLTDALNGSDQAIMSQESIETQTTVHDSGNFESQMFRNEGDALTSSDITEQNMAETKINFSNTKATETQTLETEVSDASTGSDTESEYSKVEQNTTDTQTPVSTMHANETQTSQIQVADASTGLDSTECEDTAQAAPNPKAEDSRNTVQTQTVMTQEKSIDDLDRKNVDVLDRSCQTEQVTPGEYIKVRCDQSVEVQTTISDVTEAYDKAPMTESISALEDTSCQTDDIYEMWSAKDTQTINKEVTDSGNDAERASKSYDGNDTENLKCDMCAQTDELVDVRYDEDVLKTNTEEENKKEELPVITYENIAFTPQTTTWFVKEMGDTVENDKEHNQGVSIGCQVDETDIGFEAKLERGARTDKNTDDVFVSQSDSSDKEDAVAIRELSNDASKVGKRRRKLNLQITKLDQISIEPDLAHQGTFKSVTFQESVGRLSEERKTEDHAGAKRRPYKIEELTVDTSPDELSRCINGEQTSPLSISSDAITCSSSREYSPDNDRSYPSEDETPLSPLPLDETPDSGFADSPNFVYKKLRISSVDPSDLELSADRLSPVVESFSEADTAQNWEGTISLREHSCILKERRQAASTLSADYSSTDDNLKPQTEERKKPATLKRTGSSSPRRGRKASPMRPRRYISSDESSEEEEEEEVNDLKISAGKSVASTPAKTAPRLDYHSGESEGTSSKYQLPHHGQQGVSLGDLDDSYHKELPTDGSSTPSGYGSMADDTASTDGSVLDRSDDNVLDKHLSVLNDSQIAWNLARNSPGPAMTTKMMFTTDDGTEIVVRSPADGANSPASVKSPRTLTPREQETLFKDIPYESKQYF